MNLDELIEQIEALGYKTELTTSNPEKPNQQLLVYEHSKKEWIAKLSLGLACRIDTMRNGVGRKQKELLQLLVDFSVRI